MRRLFLRLESHSLHTMKENVMTYTSSGRVATTLALRPETREWLKSRSYGPRGLADVVDVLVQEKRLLEPFEKRVSTLERRIDSLTERRNEDATT
jgi:hypothetical protein